MSFQIPSELDENKVFLTKRSMLQGRLDPFFYIPDMVAIDNLVTSKSRLKLGHLILDMNGGATPKKSEEEKFYSDERLGVPLLRVQNITDEGINTTNAIYINHDTHNGYLQRSQVTENDLLVTITGRIASSAVVPKHFIGNINQHSVVIKTKNKATSQYIAAFLNSHVGQKLALKRTTGGTRPALDYNTLKSIPIIENLPIVVAMDVAYTAKKQKETEAQRLLGSIDVYLLGELGIELPEQEINTLENRMFTRQLSEISGDRFDPFFHSINKKDRSGEYKLYKLKEIANIRKGDSITSAHVIDGDIPVIAGGQKSPYSHNVANSQGDVITVSASGAYSGYVWYHENPIYASDCTIISAKHSNDINNKYLFEYLKTEQQNIYDIQQGSGQPHVYPSDLEKIKIPVPPLKKQTEIANHITDIRTQAKALQQQAKAGLEQAKNEVEAMILGEDEKAA